MTNLAQNETMAVQVLFDSPLKF